MKQKMGKGKSTKKRASKKMPEVSVDKRVPRVDHRTMKRKIGDLGENIACRFLVKQGFVILGRNYLKKCGEIDIIAQKDKVTHFVEVKTVSHLPFSRETDSYRPEDNVHRAKLARMVKTVQVYLAETEKGVNAGGVPCGTPWQMDLVTVYVDLAKNRQYVEIMDNVIP